MRTSHETIDEAQKDFIKIIDGMETKNDEEKQFKATALMFASMLAGLLHDIKLIAEAAEYANGKR